MSPLPLPNVVEAVLRVHAPLTLSDTETCPDELYSPNQPTSRSPACTGADRVTVVLVPTVAVDTEAPWTAVTAPGAGVVACTGEDCAEWLLPLKASTVYVYVVDGDTVASVYVVALGAPVVPMAVPLRYTV